MKSKDDKLFSNYQYPSTTVKRITVGDEQYASQFRGDGDKLLYQVKNLMKLGNLNQFKATRLFDNGTVIEVKSIFGMDFVTIDVSRAKKLAPSCSITLYNIPEVVPPMKWYEDGIHDDKWLITHPDGTLEVEGIDYIKTYYEFTIQDCPDCTLDFTVGQNVLIIEASTSHRPFIYKSEKDDGSLIYTYDGIMVPHYMGLVQPPPYQSVPEDPLNHSIYSLYNHCEAEIIKVSSGYFLWKAYTEWSNVGPYIVEFSRSGLGYMLLQAFSGDMCKSNPFIVKVDCCQKIADKRQVGLWWESLTASQAGGPTCGGQPFMFYGDMKICEVPSENAGIYVLLCVPANQKILYTIPEIKGGCLPFEWTVSDGAFIITPSLPFGETAALEKVNCSELLDCNQGFSVTVRDRCGTEDTVRFISCCEWLGGGSSLFISYTTLSMGCSQTQTLSIGGQGCDPYTWSKTGGGTLDTTTGNSVVYTAPATNVNCDNNDTVTVTDCCGGSATITLYVNCNPAGNAYQQCDVELSGCRQGTGYYPEWSVMCLAEAGSARHREWDCAGNLLSDNSCNMAGYTDWVCYPACDCPCQEHDRSHYAVLCGLGGCTSVGGHYWNNGYQDVRTSGMKTAGCCPINPDTGLPFSWN